MRWASRVRAWPRGAPIWDGGFIDDSVHGDAPRDAYLYFDNTDKRRAPKDAQALTGTARAARH